MKEKKIKILWFALTPCGAIEHLNSNLQGCGWLSALENRLACTGEVELHICFLWDTDLHFFSIDGVTYHPVRRMRMRTVLLDKLLGKRFRQNPVQSYSEVISRVNPDLIHVHGTEEDFGLIQSVTKLPVIISIQGILTNICCKYFSGISQLKFLMHEKIIDHLKLRSVLSIFWVFKMNAKREKNILTMTRHVIGRTEWDRRSVALMAPNAKYHHGDEILRAPFYDGAWSQQYFSSTLRIVTVSGVAPYKGFETIINVAHILQEQVGFDFVWSVVGLSSDDTVVKTVYKYLGPNVKVKPLGKLTDKDIRDLLLDSDIFCQVSHIENSPNSLCEAMLLGMPIIASFAGGTDSILLAGVEGILLQDGDPWSMAGAIVELSRNFNMAVKIGKAAGIRAKERHNPDKIVSDLLATYRQVTNHKA